MKVNVNKNKCKQKLYNKTFAKLCPVSLISETLIKHKLIQLLCLTIATSTQPVRRIFQVAFV